MKRTWRNIIIFSLVLLIIEVAGSVIVLMPYYKIQLVFNSIDSGQYSSAQEYYEALNARGKKTVQDNLDNYGAYLCSQYIDGKIGYEAVVASFDAINSIDDSGEVMNTYLPQVSHNELKAAIKGRFSALTRFDNNKAYEYSNRLTLIQQRVDNETREQVMVELLNDYYDDYLESKIDATTVSSFAEMISAMAYSTAYDYSFVIRNNVEFVENYRHAYNTANKAFFDEEYIKAVDICRKAVVDDRDTVYRDKYRSLLNNSYNMGKLYYEDLLDKYIEEDNKDAAVELMEQISECYGGDFDLSKAKERLAEPWQLAYVNLLRVVDEALETDLYNSELGQYIYLNEYDRLAPDSLVLHDIDGNGIPELFLFNSSQLGNDYIGCFIYNFNGTECKYLNFVNVKSFGRSSSLIAVPAVFDRQIGDEVSLVWYDGTSLSTGSYVQYLEGTYYVGGAESSDVDYLAAKTEILSYADAYNVGNSKHVSIEDGESYILAYEE